jgi:hypothetical protein
MMDVNIEGNRKLLKSWHTKLWIKGARGWRMVASQPPRSPVQGLATIRATRCRCNADDVIRLGSPSEGV